MSRPSTEIIAKYDMIGQFKRYDRNENFALCVLTLLQEFRVFFLKYQKQVFKHIRFIKRGRN